MNIIYVEKEEIYPRFGYSEVSTQTVWVRKDLPSAVLRFVLEHEIYHLSDKAKWWVWREIKANCFAATKETWGFILTCFLSLQPYRLKYYWDRIRGKTT